MRNDFKVIERAFDHIKVRWGEKTYILRYKSCARTKEEIANTSMIATASMEE